MHCPKCGSQQSSEDTKFCTRCGFSLEILKALLTDNSDEARESNAVEQAVKEMLPEPSLRRKGLRRGAKSLLFGVGIGFGCFLLLQLLQILGIALFQHQQSLPPGTPTGLSDLIVNFLTLLGIPVMLGYFTGMGLCMFGIARIIYALFEKQKPSIPAAPAQLNATMNEAALPPVQSVPVSDSETRIRRTTSELVRPQSVTESTTRRLN
ncbi:MAG: hypothetical protein ABR577_11100 [Pyrinomonadaceae bacterium]